MIQELIERICLPLEELISYCTVADRLGSEFNILLVCSRTGFKPRNMLWRRNCLRSGAIFTAFPFPAMLG